MGARPGHDDVAVTGCAMGARVHLLLVWLLLAPASADAEILYARPDAAAGSGPYLWADEGVTDAIPLTEAVVVARSAGGTRPLEIRLLRRPGTEETTYSLDLGSTGAALHWRGSEANKLTFRGQVDRSGISPRALTTIVGERPLRQILCEPHGVDLCARPVSDGPPDKRQDLLDYLSGELDETVIDKAGTARTPDIRLRTNCLLFWESSFVDVADLGFRECWLAAVATYASSNFTLSGSVIEGSTYAFAAIGRKAWPEASHTFEITGNTWRQSPSAYRPRAGACDIHNDWSCPVSIWSDIPWAVVHHHFWSPLNGALFTAKDILGNVKIAGNHIIDAYNGIRVRLSDACLASPHCRDRANSGFEIVGNTFEKIRDNAVEPEGRAEYLDHQAQRLLGRLRGDLDRRSGRTGLPCVRQRVRPRRHPRVRVPRPRLGGKQAVSSCFGRGRALELGPGGRRRCALFHPRARHSHQNGGERRGSRIGQSWIASTSSTTA